MPPQRALLLNPSLVSHLLGIHRSNKADHPMGSRTSSPVVAFQILTELSVEDPPNVMVVQMHLQCACRPARTKRTKPAPSAPSACTPAHGSNTEVSNSARSSKAVRARPKRHSEEETRTLTSSPVVLSQILTVLSFDPLTMCLPSGEYATEVTRFECPVSVHSPGNLT